MKFCFILGTRPEAIKLYSLIGVVRKAGINFFILHTGQHYDYRMNEIFFKELGLPKPKYYLGVGSGGHGEVTGLMLQKIEPILVKEKPTHVFVQGDTYTVLAGALAAAKIANIKICHVEAGLRSYDREMPEEINRIIVDHISDYLFCPTEKAAQIAVSEKISPSKVFITGNTIVDAVVSISKKKSRILDKLNIKPNKYILLTMHRPSNVDNKKNLREIIGGINRICLNKRVPCIFPVHPRTLAMIKKFKISIPVSITITPPLGYIDLIGLEKASYMIFTDSGGIQEEACILKKKCVILRKNTERPETLDVGGAMLLNRLSSENIVSRFSLLDRKKVQWRNPFGDGRAAEKIISILKKK